VTDATIQEVYGLHVTGVGDQGLHVASGVDRPHMDVRHACFSAEPACVGAQRAILDLPEGRQVLLERGEGSATFSGPALSQDELIQPYLGAAASVFSRWVGCEVFHAGAFVAGGLAWAVVGGYEAGKSSLLAELARRMVAILADDLVVTDGVHAFCGPRMIDLRLRRPGTSEPMVLARRASRWRLTLPPQPATVPLGGWIYLRWGSEVAMPTVPVTSLLGRLAAQRSWPALPSDPRTLLALAALPGWDLVRPADWGRMDETVDVMLETIAARVATSSSSFGLEEAGLSAVVEKAGDVSRGRRRRDPIGVDKHGDQVVGACPVR
jgi:hypothetical protein